MRIVTAVTGASGAIYAARFLKACLELDVRVELVVSDYGHRLLIEECGLNLKTETVEAWLDRTYGPADRARGRSSGTVRTTWAPRSHRARSGGTRWWWCPAP